MLPFLFTCEVPAAADFKVGFATDFFTGMIDAVFWFISDLYTHVIRNKLL